MAASIPVCAWSDEELVERSIGGDAESFNLLVARWERPIYSVIYRVLGREDDARDVCQETFLRAYRAIGGFKRQARFSSWLYRIALNLCRDWLRKQKRTPTAAAAAIDDLSAAVASSGGELDLLVTRRQLSQIIARAMDELPTEQRTAIILKEYQGMTFQEVAEVVGCPVSTVKTRVYQGLITLRKHLQHEALVVQQVGIT